MNHPINTYFHDSDLLPQFKLLKMTLTIETNEPSLLKKKRPSGVWFLTIWDGLFAGIAPFFAILLILFNENARMSSGLSLNDVYPSIFIYIGVVISAFFAWRGNNIGRFALIIFVVLFYGGIAYNNYYGLQEGIITLDTQPLAQGRIIRSVIWIIVNIWYFFSKNAKAFYETSQKKTIDINHT